MKKILYLIFKIVIITIILINVFSALNISFLGFRLFRVGSGSMEPNLKVKDLVLIKKSSNYEIGDIVTYKENNEYISQLKIIKLSLKVTPIILLIHLFQKIYLLVKLFIE